MNKENPFELLGTVSANALNLGLRAYCEVEVLKKELIAFIASHSSETEEEVTKRINKSYLEVFKAELEDLSNKTGGLLESLLEKAQEKK